MEVSFEATKSTASIPTTPDRASTDEESNFTFLYDSPSKNYGATRPEEGSHAGKDVEHKEEDNLSEPKPSAKKKRLVYWVALVVIFLATSIAIAFPVVFIVGPLGSNRPSPAASGDPKDNAESELDTERLNQDLIENTVPTLSPTTRFAATPSSAPATNPTQPEIPTFGPTAGFPLTLTPTSGNLPTLGPTSGVLPTLHPTAVPSGVPATLQPSAAPTARCDHMAPYPEPPPLPGKKGAAFTLRDEGEPGSYIENMPKVILLKPYWNYSWGLKRQPTQPNNIEFVPMLWGKWSADLVQQYVRENIQNGVVKRLLGFNEPDKVDQANMPVDLALELWPNLEAENVPLVSPSCAHPRREWMQKFMARADAACNRIDYIGVHWYGAPGFNAFQEAIRKMFEQYGGERPLMITEFAIADWNAETVEENRFSQSQVLRFMKQALPWIEAQDWISGYVWFSFRPDHPNGACSALFQMDNSTLNALGQYYASVTNENPTGDQEIQ